MTEKKTEGFDLSQLDTSVKSADGVEFRLKHPDSGVPIDAYVSVCGQDSAQHRKAKDDAADFIRKRMTEDGRKFNSPSDIADLQLETIIHSVTGWRDIVDKGKPVKFSVPNVRRIFEKYKFFVKQASEAVYDRSRFLPGDNG